MTARKCFIVAAGLMTASAAHADDIPSNAELFRMLKAQQQTISELLMEAIGPYALPDQFRHDDRWNEPPIGPDYAPPLAPQYFNWRKISIYGGSNEIQKNIIAKAILGL